MITPNLRFITLLMLLAAWPAFATDQVRHFQIAPFGAYLAGGEVTLKDQAGNEVDTLDLDESVGYGLVFNATAEPNTEYEIYFAHQGTQFTTGGIFQSDPAFDLDISYLHAGGTVKVADRSGFVPFIVATIGATHMDPKASDLDSETFFSFAIGGGIKTHPDKPFGLRLEGRLFGTVLDSDNQIFCGSGLSGGTCVFKSKGDVLWQFQVMAGAIFRF